MKFITIIDKIQIVRPLLLYTKKEILSFNKKFNLLFINDPSNYLFTDMQIAQGSSLDWSFPNWPSHLDHILITNELFDEFNNNNSEILTIKIDNYLDGGFNQYDQNISDHRPVGLKLYFPFNLLGDINSDGSINVLDIVMLVNLILG